MKTLITPGRLYARLSSEFREACCDRCTNCTLPPPEPVYDASGEGPSWALGELSNACQKCVEQIAGIVRRYQELYDLLDPISPRMPTPAYSVFQFPLPSTRLN